MQDEQLKQIESLNNLIEELEDLSKHSSRVLKKSGWYYLEAIIIVLLSLIPYLHRLSFFLSFVLYSLLSIKSYYVIWDLLEIAKILRSYNKRHDLLMSQYLQQLKSYKENKNEDSS